MKFLCDNCKAKYQIPDEKVAGRTLRMTCRKCGHNILIRGTGAAASVAPPAASPTSTSAPAPAPASSAPVPASSAPKAGAPGKVPAPVPPKPPASPGGVPKKATGAGGVPKKAVAPSAPSPRVPAVKADAKADATGRPSALGADFRKKVGNEGQDAGSLRPSTPAPAGGEWHVAINDVPVGPVHRDEIARKIGTGAVTRDSLAWREGFDDWRPLHEIPQLASLLEQRRRPSVPPSGRSPSGTATPRPSGPRARTSGSGAFTMPTSDRSNPALVPLGGRIMAPPANVMSESDLATGEFDLNVQRSSSVPPASSAGMSTAAAAHADSAPVLVGRASLPAGERESSQKTPLWVWLMLVCGIFFGIVLGMKAPEWLGTQQPVVAAAPTPTPPIAAEPAPQPLDLPPAPEAEPVDAGLVAEAPTPTANPRQGTPGTRPPAAGGTMVEAAPTNDNAFQQFESPGRTVTPTDLTSGMSAAAAPPLDAAAVQRVVSNNRRQLQTCYERAARGQANPPRARMDVNVTVGRSGTVTAVSATGSDFGGLGACLEQSVRRWRFPASSDGGSTRFPVVFSAGG